MHKNGWLSLGFVLFALLIVAAGCANGGSTSQGEVDLLILAAASLTDALEELKLDFEKKYEQIKLTYAYGSSGTLAQQIEQGAPAAVFLSASSQDMNSLQEKGLIVDDSRVEFARNELALIAAKESHLDFSSFTEMDAEQVSHFAIGDPASVPVGRYTQEVIETIGLWRDLENKFVMGSDVRQVLTYVESGNAELGVVYSSDALLSEQVKVLAVAEQGWHSPIVYPGAILKDAEHAEAAQLFLDYLTGEKGKAILSKYGLK